MNHECTHDQRAAVNEMQIEQRTLLIVHHRKPSADALQLGIDVERNRERLQQVHAVPCDIGCQNDINLRCCFGTPMIAPL